MNAASATLIHDLRPKIMDRRARLQAAAGSVSVEYLRDLLAEVDAALQRIDNGSYGICETCHDPIEPDRLACNPLLRFCLDHLTQEQVRAHEQDLALATQIQSRLLPARQIQTGRWETHYRYVPAGVVGGDYCEVILSGEGDSLFFAVGDVAGKGIAASLLMTHLSAIFRSLLSIDLPLTEVMTRANRLFCESTPATHYATLVAGRTTDAGVELVNAGHCRPLLLHKGGTSLVDSTGLPLGLFCEGGYATRSIQLDPGDSLIMYSDGITEAQDPAGATYDEDGLIRTLEAHRGKGPVGMADGVLGNIAGFRGMGPQQDDVTLLIVHRCRAGEPGTGPPSNHVEQ